MTYPETIVVKPVHAADDIEAIKAIAASRKLEITVELEDPNVWVVAAMDTETDEIIGGAAIQMPSGPLQETAPAELLFDVVTKEKMDQYIGNSMVKRLVDLADNLSGREVSVPVETVQKNLSDFEERRQRQIGEYVLLSA